ncbi:hypothetical protein BDZ89DRAFT_415369 [Hymenopellis radicata]|nr:hypothetical protein BDZ89DRAFT_415369 [Hymenopellis radicata]
MRAFAIGACVMEGDGELRSLSCFDIERSWICFVRSTTSYSPYRSERRAVFFLRLHFCFWLHYIPQSIYTIVLFPLLDRFFLSLRRYL